MSIPTAIELEAHRIAYLHAYSHAQSSRELHAAAQTAREAYYAAALLRGEDAMQINATIVPASVAEHLAAAAAAAGGAAVAMIDVFDHWANVAQQGAENLEWYAKHARAAVNAAAAAAGDCPTDAVAAAVAAAEDCARKVEAKAEEHSVPRVNYRTRNSL